MGNEVAIYGPNGKPLQRGSLSGANPGGEHKNFMVDNRSGLPDEEVEYALETMFSDHAEAFGVGRGRLDSFSAQTYNADGSLLSRSKYAPPSSVIEEIVLARELAERDDDIAPAMDLMISAALSDGMQHNHPDEMTRVMFNRMAAQMDTDHLFEEIMREWLIAGQVTTVSVFSSKTFSFTPEAGDGRSRRDVTLSVPKVGVIPSERIRLIGSDLFGGAQLAYAPSSEEGQLKDWLDKFFAKATTAADKSAMRSEDPVSAALFIGRYDLTGDDQTLIGSDDSVVYILNPRMAHRTTRAKGAWQHPRPLITRNFPLLEAKRLLQLLDHSLLQGGINFLVVAKKGSDQFRATQPEINSLNETMQRASRSGVVVGDHRLSIEIITPNLETMLSTQRRQLLGRKLANAILRIPEATSQDSGGEAVKAELEFLPRVIAGDRHRALRHVENKIYEEIINRNKKIFKYGAPSIWFPKIIMQGTQYFTDYQIKLYDRGLVSKDTIVSGGGFDYSSELQQRLLESERGDDQVMAAPEGATAQADGKDNGPGRPTGSSPSNGAPGGASGGGDPAAPSRPRNGLRGEPVTAFFDETADGQTVIRMGEHTRATLDQHIGEWEIGRISSEERDLLHAKDYGVARGIHILPVNQSYEIVEEKAVRLKGGATIYTGRRRRDRAIVAVGLGFRGSDFSVEEAMTQAKHWGFDVDELDVTEGD